jgi:S-adenosylmethionine/arginine decarboxylase-like enzyme
MKILLRIHLISVVNLMVGGLLGNETVFGKELLLDLHTCSPAAFCKKEVAKYLKTICAKIQMQRHGEPVFWVDTSSVPHLHGISAMQFITTSTIVVHALTRFGKVHINIFSCKDFDEEFAAAYSKSFFRAKSVRMHVLYRR